MEYDTQTRPYRQECKNLFKKKRGLEGYIGLTTILKKLNRNTHVQRTIAYIVQRQSNYPDLMENSVPCGKGRQYKDSLQTLNMIESILAEADFPSNPKEKTNNKINGGANPASDVPYSTLRIAKETQLPPLFVLSQKKQLGIREENGQEYYDFTKIPCLQEEWRKLNGIGKTS